MLLAGLDPANCEGTPDRQHQPAPFLCIPFYNFIFISDFDRFWTLKTASKSTILDDIIPTSIPASPSLDFEQISHQTSNFQQAPDKQHGTRIYINLILFARCESIPEVYFANGFNNKSAWRNPRNDENERRIRRQPWGRPGVWSLIPSFGSPHWDPKTGYGERGPSPPTTACFADVSVIKQTNQFLTTVAKNCPKIEWKLPP